MNDDREVQEAASELSDDAKTLLLAAAGSQSDAIVAQDGMNGFTVAVGERNFVEEGNRRSAARWREVVRELESSGLIEPEGHGTFRVTDLGYRVADLLPASMRPS